MDLLSAALDDAGLSFLPTELEHVPVKPTVVNHILSEGISLLKKPSLAAVYKPLLPPLPKPPTQPQVSLDEEAAVDDEEDVFQAETYADYMPMKLKIGNHHPDTVVETSSLSSVHPPDVWYGLTIPEEVIDEGKLSALQLESIVYSCQQHDLKLPDGTRAGFLLGDGAGVGKGRTLAGIIYENYLQGRKRAIWLSVSNDLRFDSERDLRDIGAKLEIHPLNKVCY